MAGSDAATLFFHWSPPGRFPEFVLGVALARLTALNAAPRPTPKLLTLRGAGVLALAGYVAALVVPSPYRYATCTLAGFGTLIVAAALADLHGTTSPFRRRWLVRLGELSYAFYLAHLLVMRLIEHLLGERPEWSTGPALLLSITAFGASLALAWLLHTVVEKPARTLLVRVFPTGRRGRGGPGGANTDAARHPTASPMSINQAPHGGFGAELRATRRQDGGNARNSSRAPGLKSDPWQGRARPGA